MKTENKNLIEEITTIGERNSSLEKIMEELVSKESDKLNEQTQSSNMFRNERQELRAEIEQLRGELANIEECNHRLQEEL